MLPLSQEAKVEQLRDIARQCGACCLPAGTPVSDAAATAGVTHVVALAADGEEAAWARATRRGLVRPAWLLCCAHTWYKAREDGLSL
jgi:hypothetical protein